MKDKSKYGKESITWKSKKIFIQRVNIEIEVQRVKFSEPEQLAMKFVTAQSVTILKRILYYSVK